MDLDSYKLYITYRTSISIFLGLIVSLYEITFSSSNSMLSGLFPNSDTLASLFFSRFEVSTYILQNYARLVLRPP